MTATKPAPEVRKEPAMRQLEQLVPQLTAADRCDAKACGARAYIRATFPTGQLFFCAHHGREKHVEMLGRYTSWLDESGQIGDKRAGL